MISLPWALRPINPRTPLPGPQFSEGYPPFFALSGFSNSCWVRLGNFEKIGTSAKKELRIKKEKNGAGRTAIEVEYMGGIHSEKFILKNRGQFQPPTSARIPCPRHPRTERRYLD
jgi:hypothetical protein